METGDSLQEGAVVHGPDGRVGVKSRRSMNNGNCAEFGVPYDANLSAVRFDSLPAGAPEALGAMAALHTIDRQSSESLT
jgi:hypothetical protein